MVTHSKEIARKYQQVMIPITMESGGTAMSNTILSLSIKKSCHCLCFCLVGGNQFFRVRGIKERQIIIASMRMTVQCWQWDIYYYFVSKTPLELSLLMLCIMLIFTIYNAKSG